jgi:hypothetical protein
VAKKEFELTRHAQTMLRERGIDAAWLWETLENPDIVEEHNEGKQHYVKSISGYGNRSLRVIVNSRGEPKRVVTLYFDRKLRSTK